jgi:hypothetical protein
MSQFNSGKKFFLLLSRHPHSHHATFSPSYLSSFSALPSNSPRSHSSRLTRRVLLAIGLVTGFIIAILIAVVLVTSYCTTFHCLCHSESCANNVTKLSILLVASYSPSASSRLTRRHHRRVLHAILLVASYSPSSSSRLTRYRTRRVLLAIILVASYSPSSSSRLTRHHSRRALLLAVVLAAGVLES